MTDLETEIRRALGSAANGVPNEAEFPGANGGLSDKTVGRRWLVPTLAAAAVVAAISGTVLMLQNHAASREASAAATLTFSGDIADLGGVRFPVPDGWTVTVTSSDRDLVTACVATTPGPECDGVTLRVATPDGPTIPQAGAGGMFTVGGTDRCLPTDGHFLLRDDLRQLSGRAARHYWAYCGPNDPVAHQWMIFDGSLTISSPPGTASTQAESIAFGLDLSGWPRPEGPPISEESEATGPEAARPTAG